MRVGLLRELAAHGLQYLGRRVAEGGVLGGTLGMAQAVPAPRGELGQIVGLVPGTFDVIDMIAYVTATAGALWIAQRSAAAATLTAPRAAAPR